LDFLVNFNANKVLLIVTLTVIAKFSSSPESSMTGVIAMAALRLKANNSHTMFPATTMPSILKQAVGAKVHKLVGSRAVEHIQSFRLKIVPIEDNLI
jgi:hypothetical protein